MLDQITPLILTYNEAPNIARTLEQLSWAQEILVVDSFSDDDTLEIISRFPQVRVLQRRFDSFASQCNFGLLEGNIASEWVLNLDADYVLTPEVTAEIASMKPADEVVGFNSRFIYCINGRRLRSGVYPPVTVLFRRPKAFYRQDGHAHRVVLNGRIEDLKAPILHDDRKPLSQWLQAQVRYTRLEAEKLLGPDRKALGWKDQVRRWRVVAPMAMLFYCLVIRRGALDGWPGFYYAFQRMFAELLLALYLLDHDLQAGISEPRGARTAALTAATSNSAGTTLKHEVLKSD